ncbi:hypothetical protein J2S43_006165 [Catenuloplanes nepalensis]|uniref:DUF3500 domain-containing protein n=1 Tax=Catenuloplanes nepalensis TaxID=587533 RepID=A0ABT9N1T2_9ACTN|nr:DUF3500 domain-containing protein [Catenuloplanes nepalensis]MDP9797653.1 hypothetical protein [Catenuloplanes nepalensis]
MNDTATRMVDAATAWLAALDDAQRGAAQLPWHSPDRRRWFYTPTDHGGLPLSQMSSVQQQAAMRLLATGLSEPGYVTASTIIGLENVLDRTEGWSVTAGRPRGRDPQLYWLRVFGTPARTGPWSWRFGGHHVSVHHLVLDGEVRSSTPSFLGADPASSPLLGGHLLRPLGAAEDLARQLLSSLDPGQLAHAVISPVAPVDIVGGNRPTIAHDDRVIPLPDVFNNLTDPDLRRQTADSHARAVDHAGFRAEHDDAVSLTTLPKGIPAASLTPPQQRTLRSLLDVFVGRAPTEVAAREAAKYAGTLLDDIHFAWAGDTRPGTPHYYRLQGPTLLAEYDNTQRDANHVHTVWRTPTNDFGDDILAHHLTEFHS